MKSLISALLVLAFQPVFGQDIIGFDCEADDGLLTTICDADANSVTNRQDLREIYLMRGVLVPPGDFFTGDFNGNGVVDLDDVRGCTWCIEDR